MSSEDQKLLEVDAVRRLRRAHLDLDDVLEDWQLEGMHSHPLYHTLYDAVTVVKAARERFANSGLRP